MIKCIFSWLALLMMLAPANAQTTYDVYYLGGQSNMDGYGYIKDLPTELNRVQDNVWVFHGNMAPDNVPVDGRGIWETLRPGHGTGFTSDGEKNVYSDRFGLELTFAQTMAQARPDRPIALIIYSRGGTSIDTLSGQRFGTWDPDFKGENGINQFDHFLATIRNATRVRDIDGDGKEDTLNPAGILWMQGESDATYSAERALRYKDNLKRMMDLVRAALLTDDLPVVIGRISESGLKNNGKVWTWGHIVRRAQEAYVAEEVNAGLVTSTDNYQYSDPWHYDSAGYIDMGRQFAKELLKMLE